MRIRSLTGVQVSSPNGLKIPEGRWISPPSSHDFSDLLWLWRKQMIHVDIEARRECEWERDGQPSIFWMSPLTIGDGYGTAAENLLLALDEAGAAIYAQDCWFVDKTGLNSRTIELLGTKPNKPIGVGLCMATPADFHRLPTYFRIGLTMYEADDPLKRVPEWRHYCESVDMLIVPSQYCKDVFGTFVDKPIEVVPLPINPMYENPRRRTSKDTFTFITYGTLSGRKSPIETLHCFQEAFPEGQYPDARLILKTRGGVLGFEGYAKTQIDDQRVTVVNETWMPDRLLQALYDADCGLFLTRGEGYGMPPREMMATGLPVIFAANTGLRDLANSDVNWPIETAAKETCPLGGEWRIPNWGQAIDAMRWVYEHREKAYDRAIKGAAWLKQRSGRQAVGKRMKEILVDLPRRNPRRYFLRVETPSSSVFDSHQEFYESIERVVPKGSLILDVGVGPGLAYEALQKRGYKMAGVLLAEGDADVVGGLEARGVTTRIIANNLSPNRLRNRIMALGLEHNIGAIVCQGVLQQYTPHEIRTLVDQMVTLAPNKTFVSVPTAFYEYAIDDHAIMQRMEYWDDTLDAVEMEMGYYAGGQHLYMRLIRSIPSEMSRKRHGYLHHGHWVPGNQMLRDMVAERRGQ